MKQLLSEIGRWFSGQEPHRVKSDRVLIVDSGPEGKLLVDWVTGIPTDANKNLAFSLDAIVKVDVDGARADYPHLKEGETINLMWVGYWTKKYYIMPAPKRQKITLEPTVSASRQAWKVHPLDSCATCGWFRNMHMNQPQSVPELGCSGFKLDQVRRSVWN